MTTYLLALDQGTSSSRAIVFDTQGRIVASAPSWSCRRSTHSPAGWSTTRAKSGAPSSGTARDALAKAGLQGQRHPLRWASPTSARPPSSGTARPASPSTTASSGKTAAPSPPASSCAKPATATPSCKRPACALTPTSRAPSCSGCWTTCPARATPPSAASWPSARWTAG